MSFVSSLASACKISSIASLFTTRLRISSTDTITRLVSNTAKGEVLPPKRPPSPFLVFLADERKKGSVKYPDLKPNDLLRRISAEWKALPLDAKKEFLDTFVNKMHTFKEEEKKWWQSLSKEQKEEFAKNKKLRSTKRAERRLKMKKRNLGQPVKARTAFNFYVAANFKDEADTGGDIASQRERFTKISESWNKLTDAERKVYRERAGKDRDRYLGEMNAWELQMMRSGHSDVVRQSTAKSAVPAKRRADDKEPTVKKK